MFFGKMLIGWVKQEQKEIICTREKAQAPKIQAGRDLAELIV